MLVTCQRFGDLFLFGLVWQYSSVQTKYNKGKFKVTTCSSNITLSLHTFIHWLCFEERDKLNEANMYENRTVCTYFLICNPSNVWIKHILGHSVFSASKTSLKSKQAVGWAQPRRKKPTRDIYLLVFSVLLCLLQGRRKD